MAGQAFWSYRRVDDEHDAGRISRFAAGVRDEFETITGERLVLFLDRDSLGWGDKWNERIANAVNDATFFIPVLTPRYFLSGKCREEFRAFVAKARQLGATERILGLVYIEVPDLTPDSTDELKRWTAAYQHRSVTHLRWVEPDSLEFLRAANEVAAELARLERATTLVVNAMAEPVVGYTDVARDAELIEDVPAESDRVPEIGFPDLVVEADDAVPRIAETMAACASALNNLGEITGRYQAPLREAPTANAKLAVLTRFTDEIRPVGDVLERGSTDFIGIVEDVDLTLNAVFDWPTERLSESELHLRSELAERVRDLRRKSNSIRGSLRNLRGRLSDILRASRVLQSRMGKIDNSILTLADGQAIIERWVASDGDRN